MKRFLLTTLFLLSVFSIFSQQSKIDSLTIEFNKSKVDTTKAKILSEIGVIAYSMDRVLASKINDSLISFSKTRSDKYLSHGSRMKGTLTLLNGDYDEAENYYLKALEILKKISYQKGVAALYSNLGTYIFLLKNRLFQFQGDPKQIILKEF